MADRLDVGSQVALGALLDTDCLELAFVDDEILADTSLWVGGGAAEVLAAHPALQPFVQAAVVSPRTRVRATVAARPDLDPAMYSVLSVDLERTVRARVAANHSSPTAVLERLAHDPEPAVCESAVGELRRRATPVARAG